MGKLYVLIYLIYFSRRLKIGVTMTVTAYISKLTFWSPPNKPLLTVLPFPPNTESLFKNFFFYLVTRKRPPFKKLALVYTVIA